jgi:hypothetical protein
MEIWYDVACETRRSGVHGREDGAECVVGGRSRCSRDLMQVKISERPGLISTDTPATEWARIGGGGLGPAFQGMGLAQLGMASWRCPLWREGDCASLTHHTDTDGAPSPHSLHLHLSLSRSHTLTPQEPPISISPPTTHLEHSRLDTYPPSLATHNPHSHQQSRPTGKQHRIRTTHS